MGRMALPRTRFRERTRNGAFVQRFLKPITAVCCGDEIPPGISSGHMNRGGYSAVMDATKVSSLAWAFSLVISLLRISLGMAPA